MKYNLLAITILTFLLTSCKNEIKPDVQEKLDIQSKVQAPKFKNKGHELVYNMVQKVGDYNKLLEKKDVIYTYTYQTPDGKSDVSTEKYIFDGELSYGAYKKHERTLDNLTGLMEQGFDGKEYWLKHNGKELTDTNYLKRVAFNRPTNFYWFCMMQKLLDPSLNYKFLEEKTIDNTIYDVVKITFETKNEKPTDIYQLYINKDSGLVDQFLFTVADFGKMEPLLMKMEYENIEGLLIPTKRIYKNSDWNAIETDKPWIKVNWTNIKFNNNLTKEVFKK